MDKGGDIGGFGGEAAGLSSRGSGSVPHGPASRRGCVERCMCRAARHAPRGPMGAEGLGGRAWDHQATSLAMLLSGCSRLARTKAPSHGPG